MKQKFSDKYPVLGLLLFTYGSFIISEFVVGLLLIPILKPLGLKTTTTVALGGSIGSILVLILWYLINQPKYRFMPRSKEISGTFKLTILPMLIYWIALFGSYAYFVKGFPFDPISLEEIFMCFMAGLVEEICFREIAVSYMAKHWLSEKRIPLIAVMSGFLFGLTHLSNAIGGNEIGTALAQAVLCVFLGIFFAGIYLRKGNVWVLCLFHVTHDLLAFMGANAIKNSGIGELPDWIMMFLIVIEFMLALFGFYYIRKAKRQEIIDLWNYKWSRD